MDGQLDVEQIDSHGAFYWFFEVCRRTMLEQQLHQRQYVCLLSHVAVSDCTT
jgi:hypothetical protein